MSAEHFAHPEWMMAAVAVCLGAALAVRVARWIAGRHLGALLGTGARPRARHLRSDGALLLALAAIAAALLGPRLGERAVRVAAAGVDVVFAVDVSRSMDAADVPPSRLARARRAVEELLARLEPPDRAALAAFGGRGVLLAPLTPDREALAELLSALDTDLVRPPASDLGSGVRAALGAFERGSDRPRVLVVVSDGEDPEHRRDLGVAEALSAEVRVLAAALGTDLGAPVPDRGAPMRDASGSVVVSRRDAARLARLAAATGGTAFAGDRWGRFDFDRLAAAIRRDAAGAAPVWRRVRAVRAAPFAALAFALLLVEGLPRPRGFRPRRRALLPALAPLAAALLGIAAVAPDLEARRSASPPDARRLVDLGLERLGRGEHRAAERAFLAAAVAARDPRVAATAYYDLGVAALGSGDWEAARGAFFDALALDPADRQARFNLEWTLQLLAQRRAVSAPQQDPAGEEGDTREERKERPDEVAAERAGGPADRDRPASRPLRDAQRRRWLESIGDDPVRALRSAARPSGGDPGERRRRRGPAW